MRQEKKLIRKIKTMISFEDENKKRANKQDKI